MCCLLLSSGRDAHAAEYQFWVAVSIPIFSNCDPVGSYLLQGWKWARQWLRIETRKVSKQWHVIFCLACASSVLVVFL